jgi:sulfur-oxidizing protein SoxA
MSTSTPETGRPDGQCKTTATGTNEPRRALRALCTCLILTIAWLAIGAPCARASDDTIEAIARDRQWLAEDNPAELWEARGAALWHQPGGPAGNALDRCDLGLGPGVVKGAYAQLPRWFEDAAQVMDLEQRLMWCMTTLQGLTQAQAAQDHFGNGERRSALEALSAYIAGQSRGLPVAVAAEHPEERRLLALGRQLFYYRAGSHDFACATCHGSGHQRIRLQMLPELTKAADARLSWTSWPAYRLSQGELRTMQHRMYDCFRQQRFPEVIYGSEVVTALSLFMAHNAQGGVMDAPSIKR